MRRIKKALFHPLPVLALVLIGSVSVRLESRFGPVLATTAARVAPAEDDSGAKVCGLPELELMYQTLLSDREVLDKRLVAASERERDLEMADGLIRESFEELRAMQAEFDAKRAQFEQERLQVVKDAERDVEQLVLVYESMKPKDAAKLFETMSPEFAAGFLGRMQPQIAGDILSSVSSDFAYAVSVLIAARNSKSSKAISAIAEEG